MLVGAQDVSRFGPCAHTGEPTRGADMPDGIFLGRGGLAPENFLATVDEVRSVSRNDAWSGSLGCGWEIPGQARDDELRHSGGSRNLQTCG